MTEVSLKVLVPTKHAPLFRRLVVSSSTGYAELVKVIGKKMFTYQDDEGDTIGIASQAEFDECLRLVAQRPLRLNAGKPGKPGKAAGPAACSGSSSSSSSSDSERPQAGFPTRESMKAMRKAAREAKRSFHAARAAAMRSVRFPGSGAVAPGLQDQVSHCAQRCVGLARDFARFGGITFPPDVSPATTEVAPVPQATQAAPIVSKQPEVTSEVPLPQSVPAPVEAPLPVAGDPSARVEVRPELLVASGGAEAEAAAWAAACAPSAEAPEVRVAVPAPAAVCEAVPAETEAHVPLVALGFPESLARDVLAFHSGDIAAAHAFLRGN